MSSKDKNLSHHDAESVPSARKLSFGIVVSEWNSEITEALFKAAHETLLKYGAKGKDIIRINVPGSFELTLGAQKLVSQKKIDAVICLGCVIQGETRHFDFICEAVANGITQLNIIYGKPVIFGVLTTNTLQQAKERAGGKHGNKGVEAAVTAIKMAAL
ncbi:MAG: 6,7-dimethyl-8-ribityllumazine synthase [Bacteroidota bacterium]